MRRFGQRSFILACAALGALCSTPVQAGTIFGFTGATLGGGFRWDAAPRMMNISGDNFERSLNGGLRYSVQGGSYQSFRDQFAWSGAAPSVPDFTAAVAAAFSAWSSVDAATGLGTQLSFVADFGTPVVGVNSGAGGLDTRGAEIDLFASTDAGFWNVGDNGLQGETRFNTQNFAVTLTSGTPNYAGSRAIAGADIILNSNPTAEYSLDVFRRLLTHEIGHALGLGDVEGDINPGVFIDDNFDGSSSATANATLNNSWALMVNPVNPGASAGLARYTVPFANPGTQTPGVDILMESRGLGIAAGNPVGNLVPLTNDDYGTRQFLYPEFAAVEAPEPATLAVFGVAMLGLVQLRRAPARRRAAQV